MSAEQVRVLITNDDGVESAGLVALADAASQHWDVVVVAPSTDRSGSAAAIGPLGRDPVRRIDVPQRPDMEMYAVDAPPSVAVLAAHAGAFGAVPTAVLSGINLGVNVGRGIMHSGTVGAALTAASLGMAAVAISIDPGPDRAVPPDWALAASLAVDQLRELMEQKSTFAANVNIPCQPKLRSLTPATLASSGRVTAAVEGGALRFELIVASDAAADEGSDAALLASGHPTVTMLDPLGGAGAPIESTHMEAVPEHSPSELGPVQLDADRSGLSVGGVSDPKLPDPKLPDPKLLASSTHLGPFDDLAPANSVDDASSPEAIEPNEPA